MNNREFKSPYDWGKFCLFLKKTNRYILNKEWTDFKSALLSSAQKRETFLEEGARYVRARVGSYEKESEGENGLPIIKTGPHCPRELGAPPPERTKNGRINPRGISYLYLSNEEKTAILEVKAWIGQKVSIGYFELKKRLKCIDVSQDKKTLIPYWGGCEEKLNSEEREKAVWGAINSSFSEPIRSADDTINYIPTQYLSELFKNNGYDGIIYKSSLMKKGYNIVLFNPEDAILSGAKVFEIDSIMPSISECDNSYKCKKHVSDQSH
nr:RES family NAD+ phosphorylase [Desulfobacula sp.]